MSSLAELEEQIVSAVKALVDDGLLTEQFLELVRLQDSSEPTFLSELAGIFFSTAEEKLREMNRMLADEAVGGATDYPELDNIAHKLKGSSASFGARVVAEECGALREACESRQREACRGVVARQAAALEALKGRLQEVMELDARRRALV
ncbi:unnamed protein product [Ostreobium quekettii]|uniref:Histidine-containing phosphotransfer protein n=1 Tax=Ostreobium quekettii TaxID=121088 RepID=A0A8S1JB51_9CHLO|nr:unnamed protein product [Ostreobium quekettii]|eukprot:evm.model.scf_546EXC.6 EVM.evm.TU.scf_546EXC.6   scf_546EXC:79756-80205(+)